MKKILMGGVLLASLCGGVWAQECKSQAEYAKAREVIKDLGRIVAPTQAAVTPYHGQTSAP